MRKLWLSVLLVALLLLTISPTAVLAKSDGAGQVNATDIQIVKKVTLHGPAAKGGKTVPTAAFGSLGARLSNNANKYAIVIGINDYPGSSSDLQYTVADADEMSKVLTSIYGFPASNVHELTNDAATYDAIKTAIADVRSSANPGDEVVFFFSGHGAKGKADDGDKNNVDQAIVVQQDGQFAFIWDGELVQWFSGFLTNRIIFVFDSCLAGGMAVLKAPGRVVCMASTINGMSLEGTAWGGGHGQFTYYFAEAGMESGLAGKYDYNGDRTLYQPQDVSVEEAFDYANANCKSQTPTIADGFDKDLLP
jgi:hypothetical protein